MVKKLAALGLVEHAPYRGVSLTDDGQRVAVEVTRHHRLLELYLAETLGIDVADVHAEADRLEHVISEELEARIDQALGYPTHDPHGDPIPDADLNWPPSSSRGEPALSAKEEPLEKRKHLASCEGLDGRRPAVVLEHTQVVLECFVRMRERFLELVALEDDVVRARLVGGAELRVDRTAD